MLFRMIVAVKLKLITITFRTNNFNMNVRENKRKPEAKEDEIWLLNHPIYLFQLSA